MKKNQHSLLTKIGLYAGVAVFIFLCIALNRVLNRPETKVMWQVDKNNNDIQTLWISEMSLWDYGSDWETNIIYVVDRTEHLLAIDSLTGLTVWEIPLAVANGNGDFNQFGAHYFFANDQTLFTVTSTHVNAYRTSTGELLWYTKLGDGHVGIYVQEEDALLRVYYGGKIFEISQASGEILSVRPKDNIVWIQNNIEIHCLLLPHEEGAGQGCRIGLTGVDRATEEVLWRNYKPTFWEGYQGRSVNNAVFVEYPEDGICALNPNTGEYDWCLPEGRISDIAIADDGEIGFFLRDDFSLVKINLLTGGILAEIKFLPVVPTAEIQEHSYGRVVVTKDVVIVNIGNSDQTFGLSFNP